MASSNSTTASGMSVFLNQEINTVDDDASTISGATNPSADDSDNVALGGVTTPKKRVKIHRALVTIFHQAPSPGMVDPATYFGQEWETIIQVWVAQWEKAPTTNQVHAHIYMEFIHGKGQNFDTLRRKIEAFSPRSDIKVPRKSCKAQRQGAVNYCAKEYTRIEDCTYRWMYAKYPIVVAYDEAFAKKASEKKVPEKVKQFNHITSKPWWWTWDMLLQESPEAGLLLCACSWGAKYQRSRASGRPRRTIENVVVLYGVGGSGKTTMARNWGSDKDTEDAPAHLRYWKRNYDDGVFWGGGATAYTGQSVIHLDEFQGQEKLADFKEICDVGNVGKSVNIKNGGTDLNHDTVVITSNIHPAMWYRNAIKKDEHHWVPFHRRITKVVFFPEFRADGVTKNRAGEKDADGVIIPPYVVDQTDVWRSFDTYEAAVDHAEEFWDRGQGDDKDQFSAGFFQPDMQRAGRMA